jgi:3-dehydroquinate synthase
MTKMMTTNIFTANFEKIQEFINEIDTDILLIVVDGRLWQTYKRELTFEQPGKKTYLYTTPSGETTKTIYEYEKCAEFLLAKGIHRKSHLVAIGGGATSDMAGFIAATLLRGIPWSVIPSTLLSMVDAAIGGKVAINSKAGKNLLGAFHLPKNVILNTSFLKSLPAEEVVSGLGEVIKYGFLSKEIHEDLMASEAGDQPTSVLSDAIILKCAEYKQNIVNEDFNETGKRKILNLGHTFGHAYELLYSIPHGEAVVWGMLTIFLLDQREDLLQELKVILAKYHWKKEVPPWHNKSIPVEKIFDYVLKDKKVQNSESIDLVKIEKIGKPLIERCNLVDLEKSFEQNSDLLRTFKFHA